MDPNTVIRVSTQSLTALNDERVMVPSMYSEAVADLKTLLRQLAAGKLMVGTPAPQQEAVAEDGGAAEQ